MRPARVAPFALLLAACRGSDTAPEPEPPVMIVQPPATAGTARNDPIEGADDNPRAVHVRSHYTKFEYRIPMRDGVRLFTAVYVPADASAGKTYPFLLTRTPYSSAPYGADRYPSGLGLEAMERDGYIFVKQDVRGRYLSEGEFTNVRPHIRDKSGTDVDESSDTFDTIAWLLEHVPHNNGKAGMWGVSYPGFYTSAGAIDSHPALVAISPQAPVSDWWRGDDMHRNGAFNLQLAFTFFAGNGFGRPRPAPTSREIRDPFPYGTPDGYRFFLELGPLSEIDAAKLGGEIPFWTEVASHPDYDDFWRARNILPNLQNIRATTMVVGGWYDTEDLYGALETYRAIEAQNPRTTNTLVMGPWRHGGWNWQPGDRLGDEDFGFATAEPYRELVAAFFRHHLKGGPALALPEAMVFETGADRWRRFDAWPPAAVEPTALYLRENGGLSFDPPTTDGVDEYVSDPAKPVPFTQRPLTERWSAEAMAEDQRFVASRPDVLVYRTKPLANDVTIAGPIVVELQVSTTGTDADFVVKLVDGFPGVLPGSTEEKPEPRGGQQLLVRGEPFRGRYRVAEDRPEPFVPGEISTIRFTLDDVFHTFQRGHEIVIHVQSSWFPFVDRNPQTFVPNIFRATRVDFVKATHRVHRLAATPSKITVGLLPAADAEP